MEAVMRGVTQFGLWTSAGLYIAIGVIGVVLFSVQSPTVTTTDGYGIAPVVIAAASPSIHP
jgi:hypothetical protein